MPNRAVPRLPRELLAEIAYRAPFSTAVRLMLTCSYFASRAEEYYTNYWAKWAERARPAPANPCDLTGYMSNPLFELEFEGCTREEVEQAESSPRKGVLWESDDYLSPMRGAHCYNEYTSLRRLPDGKLLLAHVMDEWSCGYYYANFWGGTSVWAIVRLRMDEPTRRAFLRAAETG